tara:strand:+ start:171 stop:926 length:756 start_codon:yes stop_codon:yes gene_type:complete
MASQLTSPKKDAFTIIEEAFKDRGTQTHPSIYQNLLDYLRKNRYTHKKSYKYYRNLSRRLVIPSIVISCLSGIGSFLSTNENFADDTKSYIAVGVGILASFSTAMQSFSTAFNFGQKQEAFQSAANEYDKLILLIKFESYQNNECNAAFLKETKDKISKIQADCGHLPPEHIMNKWCEKQEEMKKKEHKEIVVENKERRKEIKKGEKEEHRKEKINRHHNSYSVVDEEAANQIPSNNNTIRNMLHDFNNFN